MLQLPDNYDTISDEQEQARIMEQVDLSIMAQHYYEKASSTSTILKAIQELPRGQFRGGAVAFVDILEVGI
jgi:hypothetical protein